MIEGRFCMIPLRFVFFSFVLLGAVLGNVSVFGEHPFNGPYTGRNLDRIAFPIGGLGAGMYALEGTGTISHLSIRHQMEFFNEPGCFAALCVQRPDGNIARVIEGPVPDGKIFGTPDSGLGLPGKTYGLPRFAHCTFQARFPFAEIQLSDDALPVEVTLTGWSPFTPPDADHSSWPVGALEYRLVNKSGDTLKTVFSFHSRNFLGGQMEPVEQGFRLANPDAAFSFSTPFEEQTTVDHCWYRGGWWDALSVTWNNVERGECVANPPDGRDAPGASLYVPATLAPGESRVIRLLTVWYAPKSSLRIGDDAASATPLSHQTAPGKALGQQPVEGFRGRRLVNTFYPDGDRHQGAIRSPEFPIENDFLHFRVGGGKEESVGVSLLIDGEPVLTARGEDRETLRPESWPIAKYRGKKAQIEIFDRSSIGWGHINADDFILSDQPGEEFFAAQTANTQTANAHTENAQTNESKNERLLADFEAADYGDWSVIDFALPADNNADADNADNNAQSPATYVPWYAGAFPSHDALLARFTAEYDDLRARSEAFTKRFEALAFPPEVAEAVSANLTILKSPTILRQRDGKLWGWEGNRDFGGSCAGTCTHVWNYAQTLSRLFPDLERSLRRTEFFESLTDDGRQAFRALLPIRPGGIAWDASDGLLGTVMKVHREWKLSGDDAWLAEFWPRVKLAMEWAIRTWDPDETGLLEKSHHNTYDINYLGPEGHCGSFYLGALCAAAKMAEALGEDGSRWKTLGEKGRRRMETELFNGRWFVQKVPTPGVEGNPDAQSEYYRKVAEEIDRQGPKYQYGTGCLSDGVLGFWMAKCCGIEDDLVDPTMIESHLLSVYRYNLVRDLSGHANPQRPGYALGREGGLLLCSWPDGDRPILPFVYSDEVWTGIEYQIASHLMMIGHVDEGLDIVRVCRARYDGVRRNPFNEYECGHWYARAMSSFALLGDKMDQLVKKE